MFISKSLWVVFAMVVYPTAALLVFYDQKLVKKTPSTGFAMSENVIVPMTFISNNDLLIHKDPTQITPTEVYAIPDEGNLDAVGYLRWTPEKTKTKPESFTNYDRFGITAVTILATRLFNYEDFYFKFLTFNDIQNFSRPSGQLIATWYEIRVGLDKTKNATFKRAKITTEWKLRTEDEIVYHVEIDKIEGIVKGASIFIVVLNIDLEKMDTFLGILTKADSNSHEFVIIPENFKDIDKSRGVSSIANQPN